MKQQQQQQQISKIIFSAVHLSKNCTKRYKHIKKKNYLLDQSILNTCSKSTMESENLDKKEVILHLITNELDTKTTEANKELSEEGNSDVFYVH